jgi:hypothetical protein
MHGYGAYKMPVSIVVVVLSYILDPHITKVNPADSVFVGYDLNISIRRCVCIVDTEMFCTLLPFLLEALSSVRNLRTHSALVTRDPLTVAS